MDEEHETLKQINSLIKRYKIKIEDNESTPVLIHKNDSLLSNKAQVIKSLKST